MLSQICANCEKWKPNDTSNVEGFRQMLEANITLDTPADLVEGIKSDRTTLLLTRGTRNCSLGGSGIYGTGICAVTSEFVSVESIQVRE